MLKHIALIGIILMALATIYFSTEALSLFLSDGGLK